LLHRRRHGPGDIDGIAEFGGADTVGMHADLAKAFLEGGQLADDAYGDLDDAVAEAAKLADMGNRYSVDYIEKQPSFLQRALTSMADDSSTALSGFRLPAAAALPPWYTRLMRLAGSLTVFDDPRGIYAYCFCDVR
ncbi:MAG: hypothetical protein ACHQAZ_04165, partial [Gammaproteobacteria bacterium]